MVAEYTSSSFFAGSTKATETGPLRVKERPCHGLRRTVAKGRNFESSGRASKVHQETFCSIRAFALCKFAGWPVYETLGLETSLELRFFFQGHQAGLGAVDPIFDCLEHCGHRNFSSLTHGAVTRGLVEGNDDISTVEQMTSQSRWTPRLFLLKKKKSSKSEKKKGKK